MHHWGTSIILAIGILLLRYRIVPEDDSSSSLLFKTYENAFVWPFAHFQFAIVVFCLNAGLSQYRKMFYTNMYFTVYWFFIMAVLIYGLLFLPLEYSNGNFFEIFVGWMFQIKLEISFEFKTLQFALICAHLFLGIICESVYRRRTQVSSGKISAV